MSAEVDAEKRIAAEAAARLVEDGMTLGLGTGTTVAFLLPALAERALSVRCVATSPATEQLATSLGLRVEPFTLAHLDMAIDGADQVSPDGWLVKGGGGAHTREKIVARTADRFVVIVDSTKPVAALHAPVPVELLRFGLASTMARLGSVVLRDAPPSPDDGVIADFTGPFDDPSALAARFDALPGVIGHGLFPPELVAVVLVGRGDSVERIDVAPR